MKSRPSSSAVSAAPCDEKSGMTCNAVTFAFCAAASAMAARAESSEASEPSVGTRMCRKVFTSGAPGAVEGIEEALQARAVEPVDARRLRPSAAGKAPAELRRRDAAAARAAHAHDVSALRVRGEDRMRAARVVEREAIGERE